MSRCGSTLTANLMGASPHNLVYSESKPPTALMGLCDQMRCTEEQRVSHRLRLDRGWRGETAEEVRRGACNNHGGRISIVGRWMADVQWSMSMCFLLSLSAKLTAVLLWAVFGLV